MPFGGKSEQPVALGRSLRTDASGPPTSGDNWALWSKKQYRSVFILPFPTEASEQNFRGLHFQRTYLLHCCIMLLQTGFATHGMILANRHLSSVQLAFQTTLYVLPGFACLLIRTRLHTRQEMGRARVLFICGYSILVTFLMSCTATLYFLKTFFTISWAISDAMVCDAALLPEFSLLPIQAALMGAMLGSFCLSVDRILCLLALWEMLIVVPFLPSAGILDQGRILCPHDDAAMSDLKLVLTFTHIEIIAGAMLVAACASYVFQRQARLTYAEHEEVIRLTDERLEQMAEEKERLDYELQMARHQLQRRPPRRLTAEPLPGPAPEPNADSSASASASPLSVSSPGLPQEELKRECTGTDVGAPGAQDDPDIAAPPVEELPASCAPAPAAPCEVSSALIGESAGSEGAPVSELPVFVLASSNAAKTSAPQPAPQDSQPSMQSSTPSDCGAGSRESDLWREGDDAEPGGPASSFEEVAHADSAAGTDVSDTPTPGTSEGCSGCEEERSSARAEEPRCGEPKGGDDGSCSDTSNVAEDASSDFSAPSVRGTAEEGMSDSDDGTISEMSSDSGITEVMRLAHDYRVLNAADSPEQPASCAAASRVSAPWTQRLLPADAAETRHRAERSLDTSSLDASVAPFVPSATSAPHSPSSGPPPAPAVSPRAAPPRQPSQPMRPRSPAAQVPVAVPSACCAQLPQQMPPSPLAPQPVPAIFPPPAVRTVAAIGAPGSPTMPLVAPPVTYVVPEQQRCVQSVCGNAGGAGGCGSHAVRMVPSAHPGASAGPPQCIVQPAQPFHMAPCTGVMCPGGNVGGSSASGMYATEAGRPVQQQGFYDATACESYDGYGRSSPSNRLGTPHRDSPVPMAGVAPHTPPGHGCSRTVKRRRQREALQRRITLETAARAGAAQRSRLLSPGACMRRLY